jgi:hypothetical protein
VRRGDGEAHGSDVVLPLAGERGEGGELLGLVVQRALVEAGGQIERGEDLGAAHGVEDVL